MLTEISRERLHSVNLFVVQAELPLFLSILREEIHSVKVEYFVKFDRRLHPRDSHVIKPSI